MSISKLRKIVNVLYNADRPIGIYEIKDMTNNLTKNHIEDNIAFLRSVGVVKKMPDGKYSLTLHTKIKLKLP